MHKDGKDSKAILKERNMNQFDDALNLVKSSPIFYII